MRSTKKSDSFSCGIREGFLKTGAFRMQTDEEKLVQKFKTTLIREGLANQRMLDLWGVSSIVKPIFPKMGIP